MARRNGGEYGSGDGQGRVGEEACRRTPAEVGRIRVASQPNAASSAVWGLADHLAGEQGDRRGDFKASWVDTDESRRIRHKVFHLRNPDH